MNRKTLTTLFAWIYAVLTFGAMVFVGFSLWLKHIAKELVVLRFEDDDIL